MSVDSANFFFFWQRSKNEALVVRKQPLVFATLNVDFFIWEIKLKRSHGYQAGRLFILLILRSSRGQVLVLHNIPENSKKKKCRSYSHGIYLNRDGQEPHASQN